MNEGSPKSLHSPEEEALSALVQLRTNPDATAEQINEAEERYASLKREIGEEITPDESAYRDESAKWSPTAIHEDMTVPIERYSDDELMSHIKWLDKRSAHARDDVKERLTERTEEATARLRELDARPRGIEDIPETRELAREIADMPEGKKRTLTENLRRFGFYVDEKKNEFFAKTFGVIGSKFDEKGVVGSRLRAARDLYTHNAEGTREKERGLKQGTEFHSFWNATYLFGNVMKYGRIITDLTGRTTLAPLRGIMWAGSAVDLIGGVEKEARLASDEVREKTWITVAKTAEIEARKIYDQAEAKAGEGKVTVEDLKDSYRKDLPKELQEKLKKPEIAFWTIQNLVHWDIEKSVNRLNKKLDEIESDTDKSPEDKEAEKAMLLRRWDRNLHDYDRIIDRYGKVDGWAMAGRYVQAAGKGLMYGSGLATIEVAVDKLVANWSEMLTHEHEFKSPPGTSEVLRGPYAPRGDLAEKIANLDPSTPKVGVIGERPELQEIDVNKTPDIRGGLDEKGIETIHKGGSVSKAIHAMVDKGEISKEDFLKAWKNPESLVDVNGEKVHISKVGLVYEGNQVRLVAGENGGTPRFEVLQSSGPEFGSDKDLHARYVELKKLAPEWLEKSVHGDAPHEHVVSVLDKLDTTVPDAPEVMQTSEVASDTMSLVDSAELPEATDEWWDTFNTGEGMVGINMGLESLAHDFDEYTLLEKEAYLADLTDVSQKLENLGEAEGLDLDDETREMLEENKKLADKLQNDILETRQDLKDKLYSLGIRKPVDYEKLMNQNISLKEFFDKQGANFDVKYQRLTIWLVNFKPNPGELKMNLDTFISSRFK